MRIRPPRTLAVLAAALATSSAVVACSSEPTAESMCEYFYDKGSEFRQPYLDADAEADPVGSIALLLGAQGDLAAFFHGLADHSPVEIRADVVAVADAFEAASGSSGQALGNPLGALGGSLMAGLGAMGPMNRVDAYLNSNCGPPPAG